MSRDRGNIGDRGQDSQGKGQGRTQESGQLAQDVVTKTQRQVENESDGEDSQQEESADKSDNE